MPDYIKIFMDGYGGYASYVWHEVTHPSWSNYFYWLIAVSIFFFCLELLKPWRTEQPTFRKDFWLDVFYMFFNFFLFSLIIYNAASDVVVNLFNYSILQYLDIDLRALNPLYGWPLWAIYLIGFVVRDFVQWWTHRLLHRVPTLWKYHQVHHSVEQMGFAAHLRYHWMETVVYRTIEYLPLALLGIGLYDFFIIHLFTLVIGHYNHSNVSLDGKITGAVLGTFIALLIATSCCDINLLDQNASWSVQVMVTLCGTLLGAVVLGPMMKYIFNSPEMHIWHHAYELPQDRSYGVNFGLSLAVWDYLFGTVYIPKNGQNIRLGFPGVEHFPDDFGHQVVYGILPKSPEK